MKPNIRRRMFWSIVVLGTIPLAVALLMLALQMRTSTSPAGPRAALEELTTSSREILDAVDSTTVPPELLAPLNRHADLVAQATRRARQADTLTRTAATALTVVILIISVGALSLSVYFARRWTLASTRPVEELIDWVERIDRQEPLPAAGSSSDDYDALRTALRSMATNLETARTQAIERERLQAFRETARRVAHEIRGPLTSMRLALARLDTDPQAGVDRTVLTAETDRLDKLARDFSEFGRLSEGPTIEIDLEELLQEIVTTSTADLDVAWTVGPSTPVRGRYESLRRVFHNIISNAARATDHRGIAIAVDQDGERMRVSVSDYGPGVPADQRESIFDPYVTGHKKGTGLGLAIARQALTEHEGRVWVEDAETGGARFVVTLPA